MWVSKHRVEHIPILPGTRFSTTLTQADFDSPTENEVKNLAIAAELQKLVEYFNDHVRDFLDESDEVN